MYDAKKSFHTMKMYWESKNIVQLGYIAHIVMMSQTRNMVPKRIL